MLSPTWFPSLIDVKCPRDFSLAVKREPILEAEEEDEERKPGRHLEDLQSNIVFCELSYYH